MEISFLGSFKCNHQCNIAVFLFANSRPNELLTVMIWIGFNTFFVRAVKNEPKVKELLLACGQEWVTHLYS